MDLPSRIPVLRDNPVFVFEARRLWGRRGAWLVLAFAGGVGLLSALGSLKGDQAAVGWRNHLLRSGMLVAPELFLATDLGSTPELPGRLLLWAAGSALALARYFLPGILGPSIVRDRAEGRLEALAAAGVQASTMLSGKAAAVLLPVYCIVVPLVVGAAISAPASAPWPDVLGACFVVVVWALLPPLTAALVSLAVSVHAKRVTDGLAGAYAAVWVLVGGCSWLALALPSLPEACAAWLPICMAATPIPLAGAGWYVAHAGLVRLGMRA